MSASSGYSCAMPSGLRMSAGWITASPSIDSTGPGGCVVSLRWLRMWARPSAGLVVASATTPFAFMLLKRNPAAAIDAKNLGGVIFAVEIMCPSTSRTVHSSHRDRVAHCSSVSVPRSAMSASRRARAHDLDGEDDAAQVLRLDGGGGVPL